MTDITFWQKFPSIHHVPILRALARIHDGTVRLNLAQDLPPERRAQGWEEPDLTGLDVRRAGEVSAPAPNSGIHVFSGFCECDTNANYLRKAVRAGIRPVVMLEAPARHQPMLTPLRQLRYARFAWQHRHSGVRLLAMGQLGVTAYRSIGFAADHVHEFAYCPEPELTAEQSGCEAPCTDCDAQKPPVRLVFVGSLIRRKGVDLLIRALAQQADANWTLDLIGDGPLRPWTEAFARKAGIFDRLHYRGNMLNHQLPHHIRMADRLILPSRFDGWGAVVNEALLSGTPVLVSDQVGASVLVDPQATRGRVFALSDRTGLQGAMAQVLNEGPTSPERRQQLCHWAEGAITPAAGAVYMRDLLMAHHAGQQTCAPKAPWAS